VQRRRDGIISGDEPQGLFGSSRQRGCPSSSRLADRWPGQRRGRRSGHRAGPDEARARWLAPGPGCARRAPL